MLHVVKLSDSEQRELAGLIGRPLDAIATNGWSAELRFPGHIVSIEPEEVATPDEEHPYGDVERPKVVAVSKPVLGESPRILAEQLGRVLSVNVLGILVSLSPPEPAAASTLPGGGVIPEGTGYGWVYSRPSERQQVITEVGAKQALIDLDIAFELVTEKHPSVVLYAEGYFIGISLNGPPEGEEWVRLQAFSRHGL